MRIKNKLIIFVLVINLVLPAFPVYTTQADDAVIQSALNYLNSQSPDAWITMAQAAAGETDVDLNYLKSVSGNLATDYEKAILALTAAVKNPRSFSSIDLVEKMESFYNSHQIGSPDLLNDDFWGILALVSSGENISRTIIQDSKNFILSNQNSDGGWGYQAGGQSDTNDTAIAVMALLEAGIAADNEAIVKAADYLKASQNSDGGFPYSKGGDSDSGSDAWVISMIYKLGQNPYDWQKDGKNPISHLKSLQKSDGSFKWISSEDAGYSTLTAYAVIALTENYYPINRLHRLRIEGEDAQICDNFVGAKTALEMIEHGSSVCGYTYVVEQSSWGPYLKKINNDEAYDLLGWLYFVDYQSGAVGADDYELQPGDEILWYFGEWGWKPGRLTLSEQQVAPGDNLEATVEYFDDYIWKPLAGASIYAASQTFTSDGNGKINLSIDSPGVYAVWAEKSGIVRTGQIALSVGDGVSQNIDLRVEIVPPSTLQIAFSLSKQQLDFGSLSPGGRVAEQISIQNDGNAPISVETAVSGDQIFRGNLKLDDFSWQDFYVAINPGSIPKNISVGLTIPSDWTNFGVKEGDLTFWATAKR